MATTMPAMKGRLGDTDYYVLSMKAQALVNQVTTPTILRRRGDLTIEERFQCGIDYDRVKTHLAPYLAHDESRFLGAVTVAAMNFGGAVFEPLSDFAAKELPGPYRSDARNMGFLTFTGGEVLVPLDGQHRLKAMEFAMSGCDEEGNDIANLTPCLDLAMEDITVVLVPFEVEKARKIFTKVNRHAKAATKGKNIVTDDDDMVAVLTREVANELIGGRLAKFKGNTLGPKDPEFTTLPIIYNCNEEIVTRNFFQKGRPDRMRLPAAAEQKLWRMKVQEVWRAVIDGIDVFSDALADRGESGDKARKDIRKTNLLGKPVAQECLVKAFVRLTGPPTNMAAEEACERLNRLPWALSEENVERVWRGVLWRSGGVDGKVETKRRPLATALIAYLAGERLAQDAVDELREQYRAQFPESEREGRDLPEPL